MNLNERFGNNESISSHDVLRSTVDNVDFLMESVGALFESQLDLAQDIAEIS